LSRALAAALWACAAAQGALSYVDYYSPRNCERPRRAVTRYVILHTTEGTKAGSLQKVYSGGETHFFVDAYGKVYRVIEADRVALHCGRSMWEGRANIDTCAVGIEMVGYHDGDITPMQYQALAQLLAMLQARYGIPDERVLTHSMVAYGAPNRWHPRSHRGRKRCGMLFGRRSVRLKLELTAQPLGDPDVAAGRLTQADPYLASVLYGDAGRAIPPPAARPAPAPAPAASNVIGPGRSAWDIARDQYNSPATTYELPDGSRLSGSQVRDWNQIPPGTRVILCAAQPENEEDKVRQVGPDGRTPREIAGAEYNLETTIYFLPDGRVRNGREMTAAELGNLPDGVKVLVGYVNAGYVTDKRSAFKICGERWDFPSTVYRFPDGSLVTGDRVNQTAIPATTMVFYRK
jgi:hypothetical protein